MSRLDSSLRQAHLLMDLGLSVSRLTKKVQLRGAGGWGDPLARDPERVLKDVLDEKLTHEYARREYGVAIDVEAQKVFVEGVSAAPLV